ncbi:MAG: hypothetical protein QOI51_127 [Nocardioidaceae bacterium]|nr:hypothetical protein [Nocardioidaceae bacterium]
MAESKTFLAEGDRACQWIKGQPVSHQGDAREAYVADTKPIAKIPMIDAEPSASTLTMLLGERSVTQRSPKTGGLI